MAAEPLPSLPTAPSSDPSVARGTRTSSGSSSSSSPSAGARRADRQGRVVQSIAHKVTRPCSRNGCPAPARSSMALDYAGKRVTLVPLLGERDPRFLEVCPTHAENMDVPRGWDLVDERGEEAPVPTGPPSADEMGSSSTVAVLAAALRRAPSAPASDPEVAEDPVADAPSGQSTADLADEPAAAASSHQISTPADEPVTPDDDADEPVTTDDDADASSSRTFDLPVKDFDVDAVEVESVTKHDHDSASYEVAATPRPPSGRTAEPVRRGVDVADDRQLLLADDAATPHNRRVPRPVPAARAEDRLPPQRS